MNVMQRLENINKFFFSPLRSPRLSTSRLHNKLECILNLKCSSHNIMTQESIRRVHYAPYKTSYFATNQYVSSVVMPIPRPVIAAVATAALK